MGESAVEPCATTQRARPDHRDGRGKGSHAAVVMKRLLCGVMQATVERSKGGGGAPLFEALAGTCFDRRVRHSVICRRAEAFLGSASRAISRSSSA